MANPDELFDLVDELDQVIGTEIRRLVHLNGLRHRAVHILVVNKLGDVFLQKRASTKETFPDCWDSSCSGHVDSGEDYLTAAIREIGEELGLIDLSPNQLEPLFKIEARAETGQEFVWVYRCFHEGPFILQSEEISEGHFFTSNEISQLIEEQPEKVASALKFLWPMYLKL